MSNPPVPSRSGEPAPGNRPADESARAKPRRRTSESSSVLLPQAASVALQGLGAFVLLFDADGTLRYWNRRCAEAPLDWDALDPARACEALFELRDAACFLAALGDVNDGRGEQRLETDWRAGGDVERIAWNFSRLDFNEGRPLTVATGLDVTERALAESALRRSEARYRAVMWETSDIICLLDAHTGRILEANPAMQRALGYSLEELTAMRIHDVVAHSRRSVDSNLLAILAEGSRWLGERTYRCRDGSALPAEIQVNVIHAAEGADVLCVLARDLRPRRAHEEELRRKEEALRQAQRLESVGQLAAGVAHDFNNLLTSITGFAELLWGTFEEGDIRKEDASAILDAGHRGSALVRQLLAFSRQQILKPQLIDLNGPVEEALSLLRRLLGEDIDLEVDLAAALPSVRADPGQIGQVLLNLAVNARDAMPGGGRLRMSTATVTLDAEECAALASVNPGRFVRLTVEDSGHGMDADTRARIFEPFFTTKRDRLGTGMGLATVHGIVHQHGGAIAVSSEPGGGARFDLYLPVVDRPSVPRIRDVLTPQSVAQGDGRCVLLVEDEEAVRRFAHRALDAGGYEVVTAPSAEDALRQAAALGDTLDLVFSDVVLPGMSGVDLADELRAKRPDLPVLLTSGYAGDRAHRERITRRGYAFLDKPYGSQDLIDEVDRLLDT